MAEPTSPCPFCGSANIVSWIGKPAPGYCNDCGADASDWNRRTPGPATKAMLLEVRCALREGWGESPISPDAMEAFIAEWPEPGTHPAPEQPKSSPWKCCVCGGTVRIADDLRPYHLSGPTNHEAELSDADLKILADGLRLTD